jgi:rhodanese-related sulfurtransferase
MASEELASADPPLVLDVRNPREWAARHIFRYEIELAKSPIDFSGVFRAHVDADIEIVAGPDVAVESNRVPPINRYST